MWKWESGRQNADYKKLKIVQISNRFDCYLIKYPPNAVLPEHTDKVNSGRHYRLNIELFGSGEFKCEQAIFRWWKIVLFRPDINLHSMVNGPSNRLVLSIGVVL